MYLIGEDLLGCVKCLFDHKVRQSRLLEMRRSGDDLLLKRSHPELDFGVSQRCASVSHEWPQILTALWNMDNVHIRLSVCFRSGRLQFAAYDNRPNRITATPSKASQVGLGSLSWSVLRVISKGK